MNIYITSENLRYYTFNSGSSIDNIKDRFKYKHFQKLDFIQAIKDIKKTKRSIMFSIMNQTYFLQLKGLLIWKTRKVNWKNYYNYTLDFDSNAEKKVIDYLLKV